jgi:deoxyguanosine kinase
VHAAFKTSLIPIFVQAVKLKINNYKANKVSMNTAFLSLGGNLGNRLENLEKTRAALNRQCGKIVQASGIYETEAWGHSSERKYLNQVVELQTKLDPRELLRKTLEIEKKLGRKRTSKRYTDRSADIDILFFNEEVIDTTHLQVPHPRLHTRNFVLAPLSEIAGKYRHPVLNKNVNSLLKESTDGLSVKLHTTIKHPGYIAIEGNIGSGKTTLAKVFAKKLNARLILEKFEETHLLPLFYTYPELYSFPLEYSFLISRFEQLKKAFLDGKKTVISDFSIYKCLWFARVNLRPKEYRLFKKHFNAFADQLPKPDLIVHLDTDLKNLKKNIKKRGRPYEQSIESAYLKTLSAEYKKGLKKIRGIPQLNIHIKRYHPGLEKDSIKLIEKHIKEIFG